MLALIEINGQQHLVKKGTKFAVNKLDIEAGEEFNPNVIGIIDGQNTKIDSGASVRLKVLEQARDKKVIIFKKRRRKHSKRKNGHRQYITKLEVLDINN